MLLHLLHGMPSTEPPTLPPTKHSECLTHALLCRFFLLAWHTQAGASGVSGRKCASLSPSRLAAADASAGKGVIVVEAVVRR